MNVFILDNPKLNEVIYNMENQNLKSSINIISGEIFVNKREGEDLKSYPLPKWGSVEGFRIMNEFVSNLKNPVLKGELQKVLDAGHGVFRKFKNVLKSSPEVEKLWYLYKKNEMKSTVISWYNQIRDYSGLEALKIIEIEDDEELLNFDFTIYKGVVTDLDFVINNDKKGFFELYSNYPQDIAARIYSTKRANILDESIFTNDFIYIVKSPLGSNVGFVWAGEYLLGASFMALELLQLYVIPEYRGLGIGKLLLNKVLEINKSGEYKDFVVNCQGDNPWLINYLELEGYKKTFQELTFRM